MRQKAHGQRNRLEQSGSESEAGRQSAYQPGMQSSIYTARQTTCSVAAHPPGERGQC